MKEIERIIEQNFFLILGKIINLLNLLFLIKKITMIYFYTQFKNELQILQFFNNLKILYNIGIKIDINLNESKIILNNNVSKTFLEIEK